MKKRFYQLLSLILFLAGLSLIDTKITASVIGATSQGSIIGVLLILISWVIFIITEHEPLEKRVRKNLARMFLDKRKIPNKHREIVSIARKMGYDIEPGGKHATNIRVKTPSGYSTIESVPYDLKRNTARRILKTLDKYFPQVSSA